MDTTYNLVSGGEVGAKEELQELEKRGFEIDIDFTPKRGEVLRIKQQDYECSLMIIDVIHDIVNGTRTQSRLLVESVITEIKTEPDSY